MEELLQPRLALTKNQSRAIELMPDHNVQLIACAGSGKTEIIARGIAEMIRQGTQPENIVAFTFTEKAADQLKVRIRSTVLRDNPERSDLGEMYAGTIHSYSVPAIYIFKSGS